MNRLVLVTAGHIVGLANELKAMFVGSNNDNAMNFQHIAEKAANLSNVALVANIADCIKAAKACAGHDAKREGQYMDEASCYRTELFNRTASNPLA